jgi:hypothetical protein
LKKDLDGTKKDASNYKVKEDAWKEAIKKRDTLDE